MKKIKYILIFLLSVSLFSACLVNKDSDLDLNDEGSNLVGFEQTVTQFAAVADGSEYTFDLKMKVSGPTVMDLSNTIGATVTVDESSTAIEGTHYRIDEPSISLSSDNNYLGLFQFVMLTDGIVTPLDESPILVLNVASSTGDENVENSGKQIAITLNYACPSELQGTYSVDVLSSTGASYSGTEDIVKIGVGEYQTESVGHWPLTVCGYTFNDVCGVITVPFHDLLDCTYSNDVFGHAEGNVNESTGVITVYYTITFAAGDATYTAVYTPL